MGNLENINESQERARLRELENSGNFVFHGSGKKLERLEPRQAHNYPDKNPEVKIPDDKPAVFATPNADIAIFMSVFNKENASKGSRSSFGANDDGPHYFGVTKETMDQIKNANGYVYVFEKSKFNMRSKMEGLSYEPVEPVEIVEVSERDLPKNIEIKDF